MTGSEERFAVEISYILIAGVILSLALEIIGLAALYIQTGTLAFDYSASWQLTGPGFFTYVAETFWSAAPGAGPVRIMTLGIIVLMLTPYLRAIASAVHFGVSRNLKYLVFTIFVLTVLTISLSLG